MKVFKFSAKGIVNGGILEKIDEGYFCLDESSHSIKGYAEYTEYEDKKKCLIFGYFNELSHKLNYISINLSKHYCRPVLYKFDDISEEGLLLFYNTSINDFVDFPYVEQLAHISVTEVHDDIEHLTGKILNTFSNDINSFSLPDLVSLYTNVMSHNLLYV